MQKVVVIQLTFEADCLTVCRPVPAQMRSSWERMWGKTSSCQAVKLQLCTPSTTCHKWDHMVCETCSLLLLEIFRYLHCIYQIITFRMSCRRREMYSGQACLCVCVRGRVRTLLDVT